MESKAAFMHFCVPSTISTQITFELTQSTNTYIHTVSQKLWTTTYCAKQKLPDHAEDEVGPKYVKEEKNHKHHIEEVVAKKGWVVMNRVDPGTVDQPEEQQLLVWVLSPSVNS